MGTTYPGDFLRALAFTLSDAIEGGYSNRPLTADPGGETFMGIARRSHPDVWKDGCPSVPSVIACYHSEYWLPHRCNEMPWPVSLIVFDFVVNSGGAVVVMQKHLGVRADGVIGPITLRALQRTAQSGEESLALLLAARQVYMARLANFPQNKKGWFKRVLMLAMEVGKGFPPREPICDPQKDWS